VKLPYLNPRWFEWVLRGEKKDTMIFPAGERRVFGAALLGEIKVSWLVEIDRQSSLFVRIKG
jgi:hypothetical protein